MDDLTKELWQGVTERANRPDPVCLPPLLVSEPPPQIRDRTSSRAFLFSRRLAATLAFGCLVGMLGIVNAHPFGSASVSERVSNKLSQPARCAKLHTPHAADPDRPIYRCVVGRRA